MEPKKRKILKRGKQKWEVDFGLDDVDVRRRPHFPTEAEADTEIKKFKSNEKLLGDYLARLPAPLTQKIIAPLALGFFGCMRPEEIASSKALTAGMSGEKLFGWHDIDLDNGLITVRVEIAKTGDQRTIRLQPAATEWFKLAKQLDNPLPPVNERRLVDQCCGLIGLEEWIRDGLRKNCCTHLRAVYKNDYDVVKDCGNSIRILMKHYAGLHVPETISLEHWKITPARVRQYLESPIWQKILERAAAATNCKRRLKSAAGGARKVLHPLGKEDWI